MLAIAIVAASQALFFEIEQEYKTLSDIKPRAEATHQEWVKKNDCDKTPVPCEVYSKQFKSWLSRYEDHKEQKEQGKKFKAYFYLKKIDEEYASKLDYDRGGFTALTLGSIALIVFAFILVLDFIGEKKIKITYPKIPQKPSPRADRKIAKKDKPDVQALIKKATECASKEPMQAISYLEQVLENGGTKLQSPALLLCGSLRIKNKIGEKQGREQLKKIIETAPQSPEAKKAKSVLDAF